MSHDSDPRASSSSTRRCATANRRPGSRWTCRPSCAMARALDALGVDIIEAGLPHRVAGRRGGRATDCASKCAGPSSPPWRAARPQDIEEAAPGARAGRTRSASTRSWPPPICTCTTKLRMTREACLEAAVAARPPRAPVHRRCGVFGGGRDAQRSRLPLPGRRGGHSRGRDDDQPAGHGRLRAPRTRRASSSPASSAARAQRRQGRLQHALPRRSRARRRQQPRRASRAAPGRSSARSTASASAPATRRSRSS